MCRRCGRGKSFTKASVWRRLKLCAWAYTRRAPRSCPQPSATSRRRRRRTSSAHLPPPTPSPPPPPPPQQQPPRILQPVARRQAAARLWPRLSMEPLIVAAFNTALVRSAATRLARFIPTHPLALLALRDARPCALQDKDRRDPWAGGMLEAAYRRGRSRAADLRSCSGMERR